MGVLLEPGLPEGGDNEDRDLTDPVGQRRLVPHGGTEGLESLAERRPEEECVERPFEASVVVDEGKVLRPGRTSSTGQFVVQRPVGSASSSSGPSRERRAMVRSPS